MTDERISRDLALEHIRHHIQAHPPQTRNVHVGEALALVCGRDFFAAHSSPVQPKSNVDGYALSSDATQGATEEAPAYFNISGEIRPSSTASSPLRQGQAVVMLTGGQMPEGADCAVAFEDVIVEGKRLVVTRELQPGQHVCHSGSDIKAGTRVIRRGEEFTPAVLATLAVSGILNIEAYVPPKICVMAIGNELATLTSNDESKQMPADNLLLAAGLLRLRGVDEVNSEVCPNDLEVIAQRLRDTTDLECIITTGGTGPGQRDFILRAASLAGFTPLFNGIALTPGKSCFAAVKGRTILFALPGTPWAVFALMHALVLPAVCWMRGRTIPVPSPVLARPLVMPSLAQLGWEKLVPCTITPHGSELQATPLLDRSRETRRDMIEAQGLLIVSGLEEPGDLLPMIPIWEHRRGHRFD